MELNDFVQTMLPAVEDELRAVVATFLPGPEAELREMMAYHLGWSGEGAGKEAQGKRIRPLLVLLSAAAAGGDWQVALPAAAAVELIHNFSLIHDDIEDQSHLRRGRPTVWAVWGVPQAINAGDTMFTLAQLALRRFGRTIPADQIVQAVNCLNQTCLELTRGQYLDISYEGRSDLTLDDYWPMVRGKTAALLGCCTELGAIVAGLASNRVAFRQFGVSLGLAFQAWDDWLGIWGDPSVTGKSAASDLTSGKKSLPVLFALQQDGRFARRWAQGPLAAEDVPLVSAWLAEDGAQEFTRQTADRLTAEALYWLSESVQDHEDAGVALRALALALLQRKN